jgi:hypothetical protein
MFHGRFDQLVAQHNADWDPRVLKTKAHVIAMLYGQVGCEVCATSKPT